jgi:hypothetical protein
LNRVLHRCRELSVRAAKLFQEHVAEAGIGFVNANSVHELFYMMVHLVTGGNEGKCRRRAPAFRSKSESYDAFRSQDNNNSCSLVAELRGVDLGTESGANQYSVASGRTARRSHCE